MAKAHCDFKKLPNEVTLNFTVKITREFKLRCFMARQLIKAAARVLGCAVKIDFERA